MDQADALAPPHLTRQETDPQTPRNTVTAWHVTGSGRENPRGLWDHSQRGDQEGFLEEGIPEPVPAEEL